MREPFQLTKILIIDQQVLGDVVGLLSLLRILLKYLFFQRFVSSNILS